MICPSCKLDVCVLCALNEICEECGSNLPDDFIDLFWESMELDELDCD